MAYRVISCCLGLLLLTAAGLKLYGLGADPVARMGLFSGAAFQFLVIVFEIALGLWLFSGRQPAGAWSAAMVTFFTFAGVTFYQGWIGQASCGCAGRLVTVNPWVAFSVDLCVLAGLAWGRPDLTPLWERRAFIVRYGGLGAAGYLLLMGALAAFAHYHFGSIDVALASLRNERLSVHPSLIDVGSGSAGDSCEASLELTNRTEDRIRIIGGTSDCSCTVLGDLPATIPPGETRSITIELRLPKSPGVFTRKAQLIIDDQGFKKVDFRLTGRIVASSR